MSSKQISQIKSEAKLYLDNCSKFENSYYGENYSKVRTALENRIEVLNAEHDNLLSQSKNESENLSKLIAETTNEFNKTKKIIEVFQSSIESIDNEIKDYEKKKKSAIKRLEKRIEEKNKEIAQFQSKITPLLFWKNFSSEKNNIAACEKSIKEYEENILNYPAGPDQNNLLTQKQKLLDSKQTLSNLETKLKEFNCRERNIHKDYESQCKSLINQFLESDEVALYKSNSASVVEQFYKIGNWDLCIEYSKHCYTTLYSFLRLAGIKLFLNENDKNFTLKNTCSVPCQIASENLAEKMFSFYDRHYTPLTVNFFLESDFQDTQNLKTLYPHLDFEKNTQSETDFSSDKDYLLQSAIEIALEYGKISTSLLQRNLSIGYAKAAKLIDYMEGMNVVGESTGPAPREVLWSYQDYAEYTLNYAKNTFDGRHDTTSVTNINIAPNCDSLIHPTDGRYFPKEMITELLDLIDTLPEDADIPDLLDRYRLITLSGNLELKTSFDNFTLLYRETPEQVLITEQRYFMEKQLEEQRDFMEKQLEEQREANKRMLAEQLEAQRLQLEHWEKEERECEYDQREAKYQCDRCSKKHNCEYSSRGLINCAAFVPKRS